MRLLFTTEQEMLKQSARKFFQKEWSIDWIRHQSDIEPYWQTLCEAGWQALFVPEMYGGADSKLLEAGIVLEQAGDVLYSSIFFSTLQATLLCRQLQANDELAAFVQGRRACVAFEEQGVQFDFQLFSTVAHYNGEWIVSGEKVYVRNAEQVDDIFIVARTTKGFGVFTVSPADVVLEPQYTIGNDELTVVKLTNVQARCIAEHVTRKELEYYRLQCTALQAIEMVGGMQRVIYQTVRYVSERKQFNVAIGSFQAVQHHLVNMYTACRGARLVAYKALFLLDEQHDGARKATHMAKVQANEAYEFITLMAHQLWGGIGYSTESPLYLWSNHAKATSLSFGSSMHHKNALIKLVRKQEVANLQV